MQKKLKKVDEKITLPDHLCETIQKSKILVNKKEVKVGKIIRVDYYLQFHGEVQYSNDITFDVPIIIVRRGEKKKEEVKKEEIKKEEVKEIKKEEVKKEEVKKVEEKKEIKKEVVIEKKVEEKKVEEEKIVDDDIVLEFDMKNFELQGDSTNKKSDNYKKYGYQQNFNFVISKEEILEKKKGLEHVDKKDNSNITKDPLDDN